MEYVPPISKTCANSFFDRSFVYAAPTLWNALDTSLSEVLCKLILIVFILFVLYLCFYNVYLL